MPKRIAVYGGSFDPPAVHHQTIVRRLAEDFDEVVVVPCGPRPDKPWDRNVDTVYRAAMNDLAFAGIERTGIDLFDLEQGVFTRTHELDSRYACRGEVWHAVGSDLVAGGRTGTSFIHRTWERGPELWRSLNFAVVSRLGHEVPAEDLPPKSRVVRLEAAGSSAAIRDRLYRGLSVDDMLSEKLNAYVRRHGLYRGRAPARAGVLRPFEPRMLISFDDRNPKARRWAEMLKPFEDTRNPNCILVIGGDGSMNHAIQMYWRRRLPFFGLNAGHLGFLLNKASDVLGEGADEAGVAKAFPPGEVVVRQMPMIYAEMLYPEGMWRAALSFNDAWVERQTGQSAWLRVTVNGYERISKLVCDGLLMSTAAGSTAYARSMGATPLLADTPGWLLVGSNVMSPLGFKTALLSLDATVEVEVMNPEKRPVQGFAHGVAMGEVRAMRSRISRIAAVEIAFLPFHDLAEKIAQIQFPGHAGGH